MKPFAWIRIIAGTLGLLAAGPLTAAPALAQDGAAAVPKGVYIELTEEFYAALRDDAGDTRTVYTNDPSARHLEEIAVSARFMVKTNLAILEQQEELIRLLRRMLEKR